MQDRRTGERLEITGARNIDGEVEIVLGDGDGDDYGTAEYIRRTYKPAEPRRVTLIVTERITVEIDERAIVRQLGENPDDKRLRQIVAADPFDEGLDATRRMLAALAADDDHNGVQSDYSTDAEIESRCLKHGSWRFPDRGEGLHCEGSCYRCDQEARG